MSEKPLGKCDQKDCNVGKDGKCLEGFPDPNDCPHFTKVEESIEQSILETEEIDQDTQISNMVELPSGEGLTFESANRITRNAPTRVIILAGAVKSGKTTLLASLYDCFQEGPFSGYIFSGSQTLPAFEKRCHLARIASERAKADTERTKYSSEENLLHIQVRNEALNKPAQDILFTDLSGEIFRLVRDSTEECQKLEILLRADHFVLLLDVEKLVNIEHRHKASTEGTTLLRSCIDAEMLNEESFIDVLFTKWDLIEKIENDNEKKDAKAFIELVKEEYGKRFEDKIGRIRFFEIAACPEENVLRFAYGLENIFPFWVEDVPNRAQSKLKSPVKPVLNRGFDNYRYTYFKTN